MVAVATGVRVEPEEVDRWREEQLLKAGYPPPLALELSLIHSVDLHAACALLAQGCAVDVAARILR